MKAFRINGHFQMGSRRQKFAKEVVGTDEQQARQNLYSILGSKHRVKRPKIWIEDVAEIGPEEVTDLVVKFKLSREIK